mgnify:CR=1 FL=1
MQLDLSPPLYKKVKGFSHLILLGGLLYKDTLYYFRGVKTAQPCTFASAFATF